MYLVAAAKVGGSVVVLVAAIGATEVGVGADQKYPESAESAATVAQVIRPQYL